MNKEQFNKCIDKIYQAIRKTYGYDDDSDELIDLICEMADVLEDKFEDQHKTSPQGEDLDDSDVQERGAAITSSVCASASSRAGDADADADAENDEKVLKKY